MISVITIILERNRVLSEFRNHHGEHNRSHITLLCPLDAQGINQEKLKKHIKKICKKTEPFEIRLDKYGRSEEEHYLYLLPSKGKKELLALHETLVAEILGDEDNPEIPTYHPHVTLGVFENTQELNENMALAKEKDISHTQRVRSINLLTIKGNHITQNTAFSLGA